MQRVSKEYRESMKSPLRERGYIMITFGLVNQEAQANASISDGSFAYYSNKDTLFGEHSDDTVYATMEENFTRVDGSMYFLPKASSGNFYDTGLIGAELVSEAQYELVISLNTIAIDFKGITINFGESYPQDFDLVGDTNIVSFRNNEQALFTTEEVFENTTSLKLIVYKMKNPQSRLRVYSIRFGYGLVYYNDSVMGSTLENYISPIGADIPQIDFSVTLKNYDKYFNVDNPKSSVNYLETGQEMDIMYGYQLPDSDKIEWIQGQHLYCSEWESDDSTATIRCQDILRTMDGEFNKGLYDVSGKTYYELAEEILADAGVTNYSIDHRLKALTTNNPIPRVTHREALQIIANACRCTLIQNRTGGVEIASLIDPEATVSTNGQTSFSNPTAIFDNTDKEEYATLATDYTPVNGTMFFIPKTGTSTISVGYISSQLSDENGVFTEKPVLTISFEAVESFKGAKMEFGTSLPSGFTIQTYNGETLIKTYTVSKSEIEQVMVILTPFETMDKMTIEFEGTQTPNNRVVLNYLSFTDLADYTMTRQDMLSSPKVTKQELVKEVIVPCYMYQTGNAEENLVYEEVQAVEGEVATYYVQEPSYGYRPLLGGESGKVEVVEWGSYFITIRYLVTGSFNLEIQGYRYKIVEKYATKSLGMRGRTIKWENPLISDMEMAQDLAEWLGEYYSAGLEYEYDTRGNPELDTNDVICQENEFRPNMRVMIYRHTIKFNQAFSGKVTVRRVGGG
jgi:hypothetical protein